MATREIETTGGREALGIGPFGLYGNLFIVFMGSLIFSVLFLITTTEILGYYSMIFAFLFPVLTLVFLKLFLNNKPPHYLEDTLESFIKDSDRLKDNKNNPFGED